MIKNKYITFINTSKAPQVIVVDYEINGKRAQTTAVLKAGEVFNQTKVLLNIGKGAKLLNVTSTDGSGGVKSLIPKALDGPDEILKLSRILDIETSGLRPGSQITQIAVTDLASKRSNLFIPTPNLISTPDSIEQGMSFLNRIKASNINLPDDVNFRDVVFLEAYLKKEKIKLSDLAEKPGIGRVTLDSALQASRVQKGVLEDFLIKDSFFQAKLFVEDEAKLLATGRIKRSELASFREKRSFINKMIEGTLDEADVTSYLKANQGTLSLTDEMNSLNVIKGRSMKDIITSDLPDLLRGGVTWIANTGFESGQFGAQVKAQASRSRDAINALRLSEGKELLDEAQFMQRFNRGEFEQAIEDLNKTRGGDDLLTKNPFLGVTAVDQRTGKPFEIFSSGEYNRVRAEALRSGDFSKVYDALIKDTRAGDVRDIQDLSRSLQSKLKNIGVLDITRPTALSVEVQARLAMAAREMRVMEEAGEAFDLSRVLQALKTKETHIAVGDTVLSESPLLRESFDMLESLRQFEAGGDKARELIEQAKQGKGGLFRAFAIGGLQDYFNKNSATFGAGLDEVLFKQMVGRSLEDIAGPQGYTEFREGDSGFGTKRAIEQPKEGLTTSRPVASARNTYLREADLFNVLDRLRDVEQYRYANREVFLDDIKNQVRDFFDAKGNLIPGREADLMSVAKQYTESAGAQIQVIESRIAGSVSGAGINADFFEAVKSFAGMGARAPKLTLTEGVSQAPLGKESTRSIVPESLKSSEPTLTYTDKVKSPPKLSSTNVDSAAENMLKKGLQETAPSLRRGLGKVGGVMAAIGGVYAALDYAQEKKPKPNYILPDYDQFLKAQSEFYGSTHAYIEQMQRKYGTKMDGLQEQGLMSLLRSESTDFGSPYRGMGYSIGVLNDYELRRERQRYEQSQFNSRHFSVEGDVGFQLRSFVDSTLKRQLGTAITSDIFFGNYQRIDSSRYNSLKGDDLIEYKFNPADISIEDADTITVGRGGGPNNALGAFMGTNPNNGMKFRLAGIDAPETAHANRAAQPYAEAAKKIATDLIRNAKEVRIVSRPGDSTYGRQVGMVYVDGKNLNLELVKRGAAAYLPYKGKGKPQFYNQQSFEEAQKFAQRSQRGMWRSAYFQAYKAITEKSGQSVTFNTLVNVNKVAKNSSLMSMYTLMNQADRMGFIDNSLAQQLTTLGQEQANAATKGGQHLFAPDELYNSWMGPELSAYGQGENSITSILDQLKYETTSMYKTRGSKYKSEVARTGRVRQNNLKLSENSLDAAKTSWSSEQTTRVESLSNVRATKYRRMKAMEELQQTALGNLFNSPIGHTRM